MDVHWGLVLVSYVPQVWGQVSVEALQGDEGGLQEVLLGLGLSPRGGVAIFNTGEVQQLLGNWGSDDSNSLRGWDKSDVHGSTLSGNLGWDGVDISDLVTPVSSSDWDDGELGGLETVLDGNLDFFSALDSESDVSVSISNSNDGLESGSLSGSGLLLDGSNLHYFITEFLNEVVNDLVLLDWEGVDVDFLEGFDLSGFDESSELSAWNPFFVESLSASSSLASGESSSESVSWGGSLGLFSSGNWSLSFLSSWLLSFWG